MKQIDITGNVLHQIAVVLRCKLVARVSFNSPNRSIQPASPIGAMNAPERLGDDTRYFKRCRRRLRKKTLLTEAIIATLKQRAPGKIGDEF